VAVVGALVGSGLLLATPSAAFRRIVPFLLVFAAASLLLQPRLSARQARHPVGRDRSWWPYGLFLLSAYNGYFGAGSGVMLLALLLLSVDQHIATANALKNMVLGLATAVSAIVFVVLGDVYWAAAAALAVGAFVGSMAGPPVARRIRPICCAPLSPSPGPAWPSGSGPFPARAPPGPRWRWRDPKAARRWRDPKAARSGRAGCPDGDGGAHSQCHAGAAHKGRARRQRQ